MINFQEKNKYMYSCAVSPNIGWEGHTTIVVGFLWQKGCSSCTNSNPQTGYCNNIIDISIFDGKGDSWKHIFPIRENVGNIGETPKIEIISRFFFHPLIKQPSVTTIKEFPMQNNLFKSFKYSRHVTEYSPKRFNYQSKMLNEPQGNCFLNEPLIDDCIPKYLIFIISISQIFSTHPELHSPGEVTALPHSHVVRLPLPDNVTRLVSLAECAELKNYIELLKEFLVLLLLFLLLYWI